MTSVSLAVRIFMIIFMFNTMLVIGTQAGIFSQVGASTDGDSNILPDLTDNNFIEKTTEIFKFMWRFVFIEFYGFPTAFAIVLFMIKAIGSLVIAAVIRGTS